MKERSLPYRAATELQRRNSHWRIDIAGRRRYCRKGMPHWSLFYLISEWAIRLIMLVYVPQQRTAAATRTWLLLIFLLPWPGLALYTLFGRIRVPRRRLEEQASASRQIVEAQERFASKVVATPDLPPCLAHVPDLVTKLGDFEVFGGNSVELLPDYAGSIDRLLQDIEAAEHHVHLLTYILGADETGERVTASLEKAVLRGVKCRVLADAVGSRPGLHHLTRRLRETGVEVVPMLPVGFLRHNAARFDLRNHRKLAVIDGRIGYAGSQNLTDPGFVPGCPNEELVARVIGPVVSQLQAVFMDDRFFETGDRLDFGSHFPVPPPAGTTAAQVLPSGPGYRRENAEELFIDLLYAARERVVFTTPYFVPDEPFLEAMRCAARRGVDVRLIVSQHANQAFTQYAQRSYYDELLDAGVHVHLYRPHFLHAKHLTVDGSVALLGSTNIDIRSFALNAEISLVIYDRAVVTQLRGIQDRYLADSMELDLETWRRRRLSQKVLQNVARLADSLL